MARRTQRCRKTELVIMMKWPIYRPEPRKRNSERICRGIQSVWKRSSNLTKHASNSCALFGGKLSFFRLNFRANILFVPVKNEADWANTNAQMRKICRDWKALSLDWFAARSYLYSVNSSDLAARSHVPCLTDYQFAWMVSHLRNLPWVTESWPSVQLFVRSEVTDPAAGLAW